MSLDVVPASELRLPDVLDALRAGDGKRVRLEIRREDRTRSVELTLRRRI